jgi:hypothetical protein
VEYYKSQHKFATDTIQGIIGYMNLCKGSADTDEDCCSKKKWKTEDFHAFKEAEIEISMTKTRRKAIGETSQKMQRTNHVQYLT